MSDDSGYSRQFQRLERILDRLEKAANQITRSIGDAGGPPPFRKIRFFNKTKKKVTQLRVEVEGEDEGGNGVRLPVVEGGVAPANQPKDWVVDDPLVNPIVTKVTRVAVQFEVDGHGFNSGDLPEGPALEFGDELHIDMIVVGGQYQAAYSVACRHDSADPLMWQWLGLETRP